MLNYFEEMTGSFNKVLKVFFRFVVMAIRFLHGVEIFERGSPKDHSCEVCGKFNLVV